MNRFCLERIDLALFLAVRVMCRLMTMIEARSKQAKEQPSKNHYDAMHRLAIKQLPRNCLQ
jgi:hypothetical protein